MNSSTAASTGADVAGTNVVEEKYAMLVAPTLGRIRSNEKRIEFKVFQHRYLLWRWSHLTEWLRFLLEICELFVVDII